MRNNYRLIWLQHLHKAAGTSIVELAKKNNEIFFPQHVNGNPLDQNRSLVKLWQMDQSELISFVDYCEENGVTFVATEWAGPDFSVLAADPRVRLITCIREPLERFISDFYFAFFFGYTQHKTLDNYINSDGTSTMFNYYCRIFSRQCDNVRMVNTDSFKLALSNLSLFDCCEILEKNMAFSKLIKLLGWKEKKIIANQSKMNINLATKYLAKGKINLLFRRIVLPKKYPDNGFKNYFKKSNRWDYKLYNEAKKFNPI